MLPTPNEDVLTEILGRTTGHEAPLPNKVSGAAELGSLCRLCRDIAVAEPVLRYAARLALSSAPDRQDASELVKRSA